MGGDKKLRFAWRIAVSLALVACAFYVGCASPEAPSGVPDQQAVTEAATEGQAGDAPSANQLYARANQAYANGRYQEAYTMYRQLLGRQDELSEERTEKVAARIQELHDTMQDQQRHGRRKKAAESILKRTSALLDQGQVEDAHQHVQMLEENDLLQYLDWQQKRELAKVKQDIETAMQGVARTRLEELKQLCTQGEWQKARATAAEMDELARYLDANQRRELANRRVAIFQATGEASVIPEGQRRQLAEDWFEQGMDAYENKNYVAAQKFLNWTKELEVDLGWWDNWSLRDAQEEVDTLITRMQQQYNRAKRKYSLGQMDAAEKLFREVAESEYELPPKMERGAEEYLDKIWRGERDKEIEVAQKEAEQQTAPEEEEAEEPAEQQVTEKEEETREPAPEPEEEVAKEEPVEEPAEEKVAEEEPAERPRPGSEQDMTLVQQLEQQADELAARREQILQSKQVYRERKQKVKSLLAEANALWAAEKYAQAKGKLVQADEVLDQVDAPMDAELQEDADEISKKLSYIDEKIEKQQVEEQERKVAQTEINNLYQEARFHYPDRLLKAEDKAIQYKNLADRRGLSLTKKQQEVYDKVIQAAVDKYGERQGRRRKYYAPLLSESQKYMNVDEYRHAEDVLQLARKDLAPLLTQTEKERIEKTLDSVEDKIQQQASARDRVEKIQQEAQELAKQDKLQQAEHKYRQAAKLAREEGLPASVLAGILEDYAGVLSEWKTSASAREDLERSWADVQAQVEEVRALKPYYKARHYVEAGSPDLARPYLQEVAAGGSAFDQKMVQWAKGQLENIDERIEQLEKSEKLHVRNELAEVVRLEKRFQDRAGQVYDEELDNLLQDVADARLQLQIAKIQERLSRAAYPLAADIVETTSVQHASKGLVQQFRMLQRRVGAWQAAEQVLKDLEEALMNKNVALAQDSAEKLETLKPNLGARFKIARRLEEAWETARAVRRASEDVLESKVARLAKIRGELGDVRARIDAYEQYSKAREAFVSAKWGTAATQLKKLDANPAGLRSFERKRVGNMLADADDIMDAIEKARGVYADARSAFQNGDNLKASKTLIDLRQMEGFALDEGLAKEAGTLSDKIVEAEELAIEKAEDVLADARAAYDAENYAKASDLIGELKEMSGTYYDPQLYSRVETLRAKLSGRMRTEIAEAQSVLQSAEQAYDNGEIVKAWNTVTKLKGSPGYAVDQKVAAATDALYEDVWQTRQDKITEAKKMLTAARSKFEVQRYKEASQILDDLHTKPGYKLAEDVPGRAKELSQKIARKEEEAQELYEKAVEAYEANDRHRLQKLLSELRKDYRYTETYQSKNM